MHKKILIYILFLFKTISPICAQTPVDRSEAVALVQQLYDEPKSRLLWGPKNRDPEERKKYYQQFFSKSIVEALVFHVKHLDNKNIKIGSILCFDTRYVPSTTDITNRTIFLYKISKNSARVRVKYGVIDIQKTEYILTKEDGKWKIDDQRLEGWISGNPQNIEGNALADIRIHLEKYAKKYGK